MKLADQIKSFIKANNNNGFGRVYIADIFAAFSGTPEVCVEVCLWDLAEKREITLSHLDCPQERKGRKAIVTETGLERHYAR